MATPLPPPLLLLPLLAGLAAGLSVQQVELLKSALVECAGGISEGACRSICRYKSSPLISRCDECYPGVCGAEPAAPRRSSGRLIAPTYGTVDDHADCQDANGILRPVFTTWYDNQQYPCLLYTCKINAVIDVVDLGANCEEEPTDLGECTSTRNIGQCCYNYTCNLPNDQTLSGCVYDNTPYAHGETWVDDLLNPCVTYACNNGVVAIIQDVRPLCPTGPDSHCIPYRADGQCCYSFNCSIINGLQPCRDAVGNIRPHSSVWYDDPTFPCVKFVCNNGSAIAVVDRRGECDTEPDTPGCHASREEGQCCFNYTCGCLFNGELKPNGAEFPDNPVHPCALLRCEQGTVVTVTEEHCPTLTCSNQVWPLGQCCRTCAPCAYNGVQYPVGDTWFDDPTHPCELYRCDNGYPVVVQNTTCEPAPSDSCTPWHMEGICCPKWDCTDAPCEHNGVIREHGTTWPENPLRPCRHLTCNNSEVEVASEAAPCEGPPDPSCVERHVPYQCCPVFDCVQIQCTYGDQVYEEDETWYDDPSHPCKHFKCTKTGTVKTKDLSISCPPLVPHDCPSMRVLGECCKVCIEQDVECLDDNGGTHSINETFFIDPVTQCHLVRCVDNGSVTVYDRRENCPADPRQDNPNCTVIAFENCCPVYQCPNCTDNGVEYAHGARWWVTPQRQCTRKMCQKDGNPTVLFTRLPCPPVREGCVPNFRGVECCHYKYTCMFDPQHNLIPMPYVDSATARLSAATRFPGSGRGSG
ncbi:kielin/chordin-like protein [Pollicipes pollicipes]|uniref:kielin/chordin-like protein n=1 Tax=Pollicipes pollicipes TaxID=41117 RepID=UPI001885405B|nr:kielin/chordin-like protein [Pollicipes pollicipes]